MFGLVEWRQGGVARARARTAPRRGVASSRIVAHGTTLAAWLRREKQSGQSRHRSRSEWPEWPKSGQSGQSGQSAQSGQSGKNDQGSKVGNSCQGRRRSRIRRTKAPFVGVLSGRLPLAAWA